MGQSERKRYTEANRAAWNEVMPQHRQAAKAKWDKLFSQPGYVCLDPLEIELLQQAGLKGKNVIHLCCNNGIELLSLKNLGAAECVGVDISDEAIKEAVERAAQCRVDCQFVRSDVYEIDNAYSNRFDIVYISVGCLGWMPDLKLFFEKAAALLRKGGQIFIHEAHPFVDMLPDDVGEESGSVRIAGSYFKTEPYADQGGLDYVGNAEYSSRTTQYWFVHTLSSIVMSLINNRISIEHFSEYAAAISPNHLQFEEAKVGMPLSYILIGRKSTAG
jgi:ubiquinone/menaquinone biosynthesis C-methylase UbiE